MSWLVLLTTDLQAWVLIPAWTVSVQPTQLFILPFRMEPKRNQKKVKCCNLDVTLALCCVHGLPATTSPKG